MKPQHRADSASQKNRADSASQTQRAESASPTRRTQKQRSRATRRALLEAARETIREKGLAGATTNEIARRAGVSRGAQVHHYASRQQLVLAVADYIWSDVENEVRALADRLDETTLDIDSFISALWENVFSPRNFHPTLELVTAARTDSELNERLSQRWDLLHEVYDDVWSRVLDRIGARHSGKPAQALRMTLFLLRGMAYQQVVHEVPDAANRETLKIWSGIVRDMLDRKEAGKPSPSEAAGNADE